MAAEEDSPAHSRAQQFNRSPQALLIDFRRAERRTVWTLLSKGKIAAQHGDPILGEILRNRYE